LCGADALEYNKTHIMPRSRGQAGVFRAALLSDAFIVS
jgi:hypothetical protein